MNTVRSKDGTAIAYDRVGKGAPLILVGGAFSYRGWKGFVQLADLLADRYTVVSYDRRGRGGSGNAAPYAVEREFEDLEAIVEVAGGSAHVFGMSSGSVLALKAAGAGVAVDRLVMYQPPFIVDTEGHVAPPGFAARLDELVAKDDRSGAAKHFMRHGMGVPAPFVAMMRAARPLWRNLKAVAPTLPYDLAVMGEDVQGRPLQNEPWAGIATPTLIADGGKSPAQLRRAADQLAERLPNARRRTLDGQSHNVAMQVLAPAIHEFLR